MNRYLLTLGTSLALAFAIAPARADVIDGEWCTVDGRHHIIIQGPTILTPGGVRSEGSYTRHTFSYVVPAAETPAGETVFMTLVNEETVHARTGPDMASASQSPTVVWQRCRRPVS